MFPVSSLSVAESVLRDVVGFKVEVVTCASLHFSAINQYKIRFMTYENTLT